MRRESESEDMKYTHYFSWWWRIDPNVGVLKVGRRRRRKRLYCCRGKGRRKEERKGQFLIAVRWFDWSKREQKFRQLWRCCFPTVFCRLIRLNISICKCIKWDTCRRRLICSWQWFMTHANQLRKARERTGNFLYHGYSARNRTKLLTTENRIVHVLHL